jgi:hypothetical protein
MYLIVTGGGWLAWPLGDRAIAYQI